MNVDKYWIESRENHVWYHYPWEMLISTDLHLWKIMYYPLSTFFDSPKTSMIHCIWYTYKKGIESNILTIKMYLALNAVMSMCVKAA